VNDNFFDLGGHSLKAIVLAANISKELNVEVTLTDIFKYPTLREFANVISQLTNKNHISIKKQPVQPYYPASSAQQRMYLLNWTDKTITYNMPTLFKVVGRLDIVKTENAFNELVKRHESLRTRFEFMRKDGEIVQHIESEVPFKIKYTVITPSTVSNVAKNFIRPFDLTMAPLFRVDVCRYGNEEYLLMIDMHHIISDGMSLEILLREFSEIYRGNELKSQVLQYKDFTIWQNQIYVDTVINKQEQYWVERFKGEIPVLALATDYPRPLKRSFEGNMQSFVLEKALRNKIYVFMKKACSTLHMILLGCLNIMLSKYSGQEDIIVGIPTAGRTHKDLDGIVGMFANTLAIRNIPKSSLSFNDFLAQVKANALEAYDNQDYQFDRLVKNLRIPKNASRNPLFDVMFTYQDVELVEMLDIGLKIEHYDIEHSISKFDLMLVAYESGEEIKIGFEYNTALFKSSTIKQMCDNYANLLDEIVSHPERLIKDIGGLLSIPKLK